MKTHKHLALVVIFASLAFSAPLACPPTLASSTPLDPTCPGLGDSIFADPGSHGFVAFEDILNPHLPDYNDLVAKFEVLGDGSHTRLTWFGSDAAYNNQLWYGNIPLFTNQSPGTVIINTTPFDEIPLVLVSPEGMFFTGGPLNNPDGVVHAWVWQVFSQDVPVEATPEPAAWTFLGIGLVAFWLHRKRV